MVEQRSTLELLAAPAYGGDALRSGNVIELLAALVGAAGRPVGESALIDAVWGDSPPAGGAKALHVLVSRARQATSSALVVRTPAGYRLDPDVARTDSLELRELRTAVSRSWREGRTSDVIREARTALDAVPGATAGHADEPAAGGPLAELREAAAQDLREIRRILGCALVAAGEAAEGLDHLRRALGAGGPTISVDADDSTALYFLRGVAAIDGVPAALSLYEERRRALAGRLGIDPSPELQRLHAELLGRDSPTREGLRSVAGLVGRDEDTAAVLGLLDRSRVVTVLGTGGLGKTTLAHAVGERVDRPGIYMVELVGTSTAEDVLSEICDVVVGGQSFRESHSGQHPGRDWRDLRSQLAQRLDLVPSLLVLDNCEHVVDAVAELVGELAATVTDLRVLATSRSPLGIAAEQAYPLSVLSADDSAELFRLRARSARPGALLPDEHVHEIVARLDGLPLAIELAAAKIRVLSAAEIATRISDRFEFLRGGDRSAPERHRTLESLIDWSWELLPEPSRRGLERLAVLADGFTLDTATTVLEDMDVDPFVIVETLVDQSLLVVREDSEGVRYRTLETVREFALARLAEGGEEHAARLAVAEWAAAFARRAFDVFGAAAGERQIAVMNELAAEEVTVVEIARWALEHGRPDVSVPILAALARYWGAANHYGKLGSSIFDEGISACREAGPEDADMVRIIACKLLLTEWIPGREAEAAVALLRELGRGEDPYIAAEVAFDLTTSDAATGAEYRSRVATLRESADPLTARVAYERTAHWLENSGDVAGAIAAAGESLARTDARTRPVEEASMHGVIAHYSMQIGDYPKAGRHADIALATIGRIRAHGERVPLQIVRAMVLLSEGDIDRCERTLRGLDGRFGPGNGTHPASISPWAEVAFARGEWSDGLLRCRHEFEQVAKIRVPFRTETAGFEPWILAGAGVCLTAYSRYAADSGDPELEAWGAGQAVEVLRLTRSYLGAPDDFLDFPVLGAMLYSLGWWHGSRGSRAASDAGRLLALARACGYPQLRPSMLWSATAALPAEVREAAEKWAAEFAGRVGAELGVETAEAVAGIDS